MSPQIDLNLLNNKYLLNIRLYVLYYLCGGGWVTAATTEQLPLTNI